LKLPNLLDKINTNLNKDNYNSINLFFQDESRYGLKTLIGRCLSVVGTRPIAKYQHKFENTYLWGSYSPINGSSFVWEVGGTDSYIFEAYLNAFSKQNPKEYKIVVIDNAGFHSTQNIEVPQNIYLLRIPPNSPELNPCEQIWQYIKQRFKNKNFENILKLKEWLHEIVVKMKPQLIKSIVSNHRYLEIFEKIIVR